MSQTVVGGQKRRENQSSLDIKEVSESVVTYLLHCSMSQTVVGGQKRREIQSSLDIQGGE